MRFVQNTSALKITWQKIWKTFTKYIGGICVTTHLVLHSLIKHFKKCHSNGGVCSLISLVNTRETNDAPLENGKNDDVIYLNNSTKKNDLILKESKGDLNYKEKENMFLTENDGDISLTKVKSKSYTNE